MLSKTEATIFLANQRGCSEATWFRSYYTFNFGDFVKKNRTPFGSLVAVNEHTLKEGATLSFIHAQIQTVLLVPIAGQLNYRSGNEQGHMDVGQASCVVLPAATPLQL